MQGKQTKELVELILEFIDRKIAFLKAKLFILLYLFHRDGRY